MRIGLIDVDGHNFPNLALMKISAWHKAQGDDVEWYDPFNALIQGEYDKVYMSKVFSFSDDYDRPIYAKEIHRGGSGYAIYLEDGIEKFGKDEKLPDEIEHIYPDYELYPGLTKNTAYGFLTRGCPRNCGFCHTTQKDGIVSRKVANLNEFWNGQKNIVLLDQNILASKERIDLLGQLVESKAQVEFNGGLDVRMMSDECIKCVKELKPKIIHFAWDRHEDKDVILPRLRAFREITGWDRHRVEVYVLVNYNSTLSQDLERIYAIREIGFRPYVMIYNKNALPKFDIKRKMQRWVNNTWIFMRTERFEDFDTLTPEQIRQIQSL